MKNDHEISGVGPTPSRAGNVTLHIERLVLDLPLPARSAGQVQVAMQDELHRLLTESGLTGAPGGAQHSVTAGDFQLAEKIQPADTGKQIANSVYKALSEST